MNASQRPGRRELVLGFNADYLISTEPVFVPPTFARGTPEAEAEVARFADGYYLRTCLHRPWQMARKVLGQLPIFYCLDMSRRAPRGVYEPVVRLADKPYYPRSLGFLLLRPDLEERLNRSDAARDYVARTRQLCRGPARLAQPAAVIGLNRACTFLYLPVLALALLASAGAGRVGRLVGTDLGVGAWTVPLLYAYNFGTCLTVSVVQTLGNIRYVEFQRVFTLFALFAGGLWCAQTGLILWRAFRRPGGIRERETPGPADFPG